jgi:hypothetical protein
MPDAIMRTAIVTALYLCTPAAAVEIVITVKTLRHVVCVADANTSMHNGEKRRGARKK